MKCVRYEPLRNTSITTLCARSFWNADCDLADYRLAEQLFGDLWRAGVTYELAFHKGALASVVDADGVEWKFSHDYAIVALAGAAEMASGRRALVGEIYVPASMFL